MSIKSGKSGAVNGEPTVSDWGTELKSDNKAYHASNTGGGTGRVAGNKDFTGNYKSLVSCPANMPGEGFTFTGYTGTDTFSGVSIVESVEITCDIGAGGFIETSVNFAANGTPSLASGTVTDLTQPAPPSVIGCLAKVGSTAIPDLTKWTLKISADLKAYVSSDTAGHTKRAVGNIDASGSFEFKQSTLAALIVREGDVIELKLYDSASTFWDVKWAVVESVKPNINIDTGEIESITVNWSWSGFKAAASGGTIIKPDTTVFWAAPALS